MYFIAKNQYPYSFSNLIEIRSHPEFAVDLGGCPLLCLHKDMASNHGDQARILDDLNVEVDQMKHHHDETSEDQQAREAQAKQSQ